MRKNILITGASSGLGRGMAIEFAKLGRNLALCARRIENLEALRIELLAINPDIQVFIRTLDVDNHPQVFDVFDGFKSDLGQIDRVIVNAGIGSGGPIGKGYFDENKQTANTNFVSALAQCEAAMAIFRQQNAGHLVAISSFTAVRGFGRGTVYAATKAALTAIAEGIRLDIYKTPIKVSTIHPGFIHTDINKDIKVKPFVVNLDKGCRALVRSIEREPNNSFVPSWPWAWLRFVFKIMPLAVLRKVS